LGKGIKKVDKALKGTNPKTNTHNISQVNPLNYRTLLLQKFNTHNT